MLTSRSKQASTSLHYKRTRRWIISKWGLSLSSSNIHPTLFPRNRHVFPSCQNRNRKTKLFRPPRPPIQPTQPTNGKATFLFVCSFHVGRSILSSFMSSHSHTFELGLKQDWTKDDHKSPFLCSSQAFRRAGWPYMIRIFFWGSTWETRNRNSRCVPYIR